MMFKYLIILVLGCSKNEPNKLTEIVSDDPGVQIGYHNNSKIMINDNDEIFIIEEKPPIDSLIEIEMTNSYLKEKIGIDAFEINACKKDLSDFRLGGNASYSKVDLQKLIVDEEIAVSKFGLNEERQPIILKKVGFVEKYNREKMLKNRLGVILVNTGIQREECEANLREARLRNGLSPTKKMADGYFTSTGVWVELSGSEKNLDDAFEKAAINKRLSSDPR